MMPGWLNFRPRCRPRRGRGAPARGAAGESCDDVPSAAVMARTHEGKACDAVIRRIEAREGHSRSDLTFPEKKQDWAAAVEVTCRIGDQLFAFEHTTIEPFERHLELEARASVHFNPSKTA